MEQLFAEKGNPLFAQAEPHMLGPLADSDTGPYILERFQNNNRNASNIISSLLSTAQGHPQRVMLLAHRLFAETPPKSIADDQIWQAALDKTMRQLNDEFKTAWHAFYSNDRRTLKAIVEYGSPYKAEALNKNDLKKTTASQSVERLRKDAELHSNSFELVDPLFFSGYKTTHPNESSTLIIAT